MIKEVSQCRRSAGMGVFSSGIVTGTGVPCSWCGPTCTLLVKSCENGVLYSERQNAENGRTPSFAISCLTTVTSELVYFYHSATGTRIHKTKTVQAHSHLLRS